MDLLWIKGLLRFVCVHPVPNTAAIIYTVLLSVHSISCYDQQYLAHHIGSIDSVNEELHLDLRTAQFPGASYGLALDQGFTSFGVCIWYLALPLIYTLSVHSIICVPELVIQVGGSTTEKLAFHVHAHIM
jgi:hypothetical protein